MANDEEKQKFGSSKDELVRQLAEWNCLKFGQFTLKSGQTSRVYLDLRETTMWPPLFDNIVGLLKGLVAKVLSDRPACQQQPPVALVGVPYGVVPVAAATAHACSIAYYPARKEAKDYGVKPDSKAYAEFQYILIEDVMSTGSSIIDTLRKMEGKKVTDIIVVVNREMGGEEKLKAEYPHIKLHFVLTMSEVMQQMESAGPMSK